MKSDIETLRELEEVLDRLLVGKTENILTDASEHSEAFVSVMEKFGLLCANLDESQKFAVNISKGNLEAIPPGRRNFLSSPLKEIHSQLISFCYSIDELIKGNMVSKLFYPGQLFSSYNSLIEKVAKTFSDLENSAPMPEWGENISSWRYHQLLSALNRLHIMVIEVDVSGKILFANPPAKDLFGAIGWLPYGTRLPENTSELTKYLCTFENTPEAAFSGVNLSQDFPVFTEVFDVGSGAWYKITSDRVNLSDGSLGILHMIDDISEWKRHELQLAHSATIDALTLAYTRKAGIQKLDELLWFGGDTENCAAFVDIDNLKAINDSYGHTEGDFAIASIAEVLMSSVRKSDWVVRYGGDEFLILFINCRSSLAQEVADRMQVRLEELNRTLGKPYKLAFSAGISPINSSMKTSADVIEVVDKIMYKNKAERKAAAAALREQENRFDK